MSTLISNNGTQIKVTDQTFEDAMRERLRLVDFMNVTDVHGVEHVADLSKICGETLNDYANLYNV
jgi:hypothetical protein